MNRPSSIVVFVMAAGIVALGAGDAGPHPASGTERAWVETHALRLRFQPKGQADPQSCLRLAASDLEVRLRGERVDDPSRIGLDRQPRPTLHGLLIDSSSSMLGKMDYVRQVARDYVGTLRSADERAIVAGFDETVTLYQSATSDKRMIAKGIDRIRMSRATSLNDGLVYLIRELATHRERPVLVLVSDGFDRTSLYERDDVYAAAAQAPGLTIFTVGLALPPLAQGGPPGFLTIRRFLQRLAARTNGGFFDAPTRSRLPEIYRTIRAMLDNEATLTVFDPTPELGPPRIVVRSRRRGCHVHLFKDRPAISIPDRRPLEPMPPGLPSTLALEPEALFRDVVARAQKPAIDPACPAGDAWSMTVDAAGIHGCYLDVTLDYGPLHDPIEGMYMNRWIGLKTRPFDMPLPDPDALPQRPEMLMDRLASHAVRAREQKIERDWRCRPAEKHARPFHDYPALFAGRVFVDLRRDLARGLFQHPAYRSWVKNRLERETGNEIEAIVQRLRKKSPSSSTQALVAAAYQSEEGLQALARKNTPSVVDLERNLTGWLGDIPAHDLFVRWEADWIQRILIDGASSEAQDGFVEAWEALRQVFYLPRHARTLTLLSPLRDPTSDRIGFWRVVLPRAGWIHPRRKGYRHHPEFTDLPLDLIPDRPLGAWLSRRLIEQAPDLAPYLARRRYRVESVAYSLLGKSGHHDPHRGFLNARVVLTLAEEGGESTVEIVADIATRDPRGERTRFVEALSVGPTEDAELRRLLPAAAPDGEESGEGRTNAPRRRGRNQKWKPVPSRNPRDSALPSMPADVKSRLFSR